MNSSSSSSSSSSSRIFVYRILSALSCLLLHAKAVKPSNHALILSSSRYWFNYRHAINALSIYQLIKSHGITDENIILMLADDMPTNPRNPLRNAMYASGSKSKSLYDEHTEIDFRGDDVTVEQMRNALLGKGTRALHTDQDSNILIYWTGHGGNLFFKFQDVEEITATDINRLFLDLHRANKYNEILFIADTCQAFTLGDEITAPNVFMIGSSLVNENSYAHHSDPELGLSVIERYTHKVMKWIHGNGGMQMSLYDGLIGHLEYHEQGAHVGSRDETCQRKFSEVPMMDFFSNARASTAAAVTNRNKNAPMIPMNVTLERIHVAPQQGLSVNESPPKVTRNQSQKTTDELMTNVVPILLGSDPLFIALVAGYLLTVVLFSRTSKIVK